MAYVCAHFPSAPTFRYEFFAFRTRTVAHIFIHFGNSIFIFERTQTESLDRAIIIMVGRFDANEIGRSHEMKEKWIYYYFWVSRQWLQESVIKWITDGCPSRMTRTANGNANDQWWMKIDAASVPTAHIPSSTLHSSCSTSKYRRHEAPNNDIWHRFQFVDAARSAQFTPVLRNVCVCHFCWRKFHT